MPKRTDLRTILVIGAGPIVIGQACEFDYSGAQACKALRDEVSMVVTVNDFTAATPDEFLDMTLDKPYSYSPDVDDAEWLSACMSKVDLIEDWCKAVRAETERRLLAGSDVPGFKLVEGRRGARKWSDEKVAEETLKAMRDKQEQMYDFSLISKTTAEKLAKAEVIGPRQWPRLKGLITQSEGKPSVAPASDKRPPIVVTPTADEFDSLV